MRLLKLCSILIPPTIFSNVLCYNPRSAFSGHNFGAYHTHDANAWDPLIDSCGLNTCNGVSTGEATVRVLTWCTVLANPISILTFNPTLNSLRPHRIKLNLDYVILPFMFRRRYVVSRIVHCSRSWYISYSSFHRLSSLKQSQTLLYRLEDIGMRGIETISTIGQTILMLYRLEPTPNELPK